MENSERAAWALGALEHWRDGGRASLEEAVTDMLVDLRHLCRIEEIDYDKCNASAEMHFEAES